MRQPRAFLAAFIVCTVCMSAGCRRLFMKPATTTTDQISIDQGGYCQQTVGGAATLQVKVDHDKGTIKWVAPNATTSCAIDFNNTRDDCPFYVDGQNNCDYVCSNGVVESQPATGPKDKYYAYVAMAIGGNQCKVGGNGIVLDH